MSKYSQIITKLFDANSAFVPEDFYEFVGEITKKYPSDRSKKQSKDAEGYEYIREHITTFEDDNGDKLAIMTYKMPSKTKVERARSEQRNLISTYLKNEGVFESINSVLVAFYSDDSNDWRLSFIKQEFKLSETELDSKGRPKIVNELTPAKRYSFLVESNSKNLTVKQRLNDLIQEKILISDIEKAFSVEKVSKEFFERYVGLYERLAKAFEKDEVFKKVEEENSNGDEHFRGNFVKKLLGQIVFLYFLQKKGWLGVKKDEKWGDGDKNFLQNLLKECLEGGNPKKESGGKNFFNDYLEWLFYDNLNRKRENDYSDYFEYRIPYLNGGLFEPINSYDWKGVSNILLAGDDNNAIFSDIFETFDEYNFTVYENDPLEQDVAVDPEMLGKVFENLLPENERKGKGAFYTPREIVHYMCKESLKNHLMNKIGISEELIEKLFIYKDSYFNITKRGNKNLESEKYEIFEKFYNFGSKIDESLRVIKIVDPAVGSGAFPMGLLKEIVSIRRFIKENVLLEENVSEYTIKKETLENCIYGVDIDPGAVEIAKLRFWLSLVIEEDSKESIDPLPNLDYKIIQGNSLIEDIIVGETVIKLDIENNSKKLTKKEEKDFGNAHQTGLDFFADEKEVEDVLKKLKYLHKVFFLEKDGIKKKALKLQIDHIEKELIRISGEVEVGKLKARIESIEGKYFLSGTEIETKDSNEIKKLTSQIQSIKEMEEKYRRDSIRTFFPWKLHFGEVFNENGGFDIVIGNPPYVSMKKFPNDETSRSYKQSLLANYKSFTSKSDLYCCFFEKSLLGSNSIVKVGGMLSFICSSTFFCESSFQELRNLILEKEIRSLSIPKGNLFETALVNTAVITIRNNNSDKNIISFHEITNSRQIIESGKMEQDVFNQTGVFLRNNNEIFLNILKKFGILQSGKNFRKLKEILVINNGIATADNDLWLFEKTILNNEDEWLKKEEFRNQANLQNFYRGESIERWYISDSSVKINYLPELMKKHKTTARPKTQQFFESKKLVSQLVGTNLKVAIDSVGRYFDINVNLIYVESKSFDIRFMLCYLNSKLFNYVLNNFRSNISLTLTLLYTMPVMEVSLNQQQAFIGIVDQIILLSPLLKEKSENSHKEVSALENKIDNMIYELYGLTPEEIELIEGSVKK